MEVIYSVVNAAVALFTVLRFVWNAVPVILTIYMLVQYYGLYITTNMDSYVHGKERNERSKRLLQSLYEFIVVKSNTLTAFASLLKLSATLIITKFGVKINSKDNRENKKKMSMFEVLGLMSRPTSNITGTVTGLVTNTTNTTNPTNPANPANPATLNPIPVPVTDSNPIPDPGSEDGVRRRLFV